MEVPPQQLSKQKLREASAAERQCVESNLNLKPESLSSAASTRMSIVDMLSDDLIAEMYSYLGAISTTQCSQVCKHWHSISKNSRRLWHNFVYNDYGVTARLSTTAAPAAQSDTTMEVETSDETTGAVVGDGTLGGSGCRGGTTVTTTTTTTTTRSTGAITAPSAGVARPDTASSQATSGVVGGTSDNAENKDDDDTIDWNGVYRYLRTCQNQYTRRNIRLNNRRRHQQDMRRTAQIELLQEQRSYLTDTQDDVGVRGATNHNTLFRQRQRQEQQRAQELRRLEQHLEVLQQQQQEERQESMHHPQYFHTEFIINSTLVFSDDGPNPELPASNALRYNNYDCWCTTPHIDHDVDLVAKLNRSDGYDIPHLIMSFGLTNGGYMYSAPVKEALAFTSMELPNLEYSASNFDGAKGSEWVSKLLEQQEQSSSRPQPPSQAAASGGATTASTTSLAETTQDSAMPATAVPVAASASITQSSREISDSSEPKERSLFEPLAGFRFNTMGDAFNGKILYELQQPRVGKYVHFKLLNAFHDPNRYSNNIDVQNLVTFGIALPELPRLLKTRLTSLPRDPSAVRQNRASSDNNHNYQRRHGNPDPNNPIAPIRQIHVDDDWIMPANVQAFDNQLFGRRDRPMMVDSDSDDDDHENGDDGDGDGNFRIEVIDMDGYVLSEEEDEDEDDGSGAFE